MRERISFTATRPERAVLLHWLKEELADYADLKYNDNPEFQELQEQKLKDEGVGTESWWVNQALQYMQRAQTIGLDTPLGRQQLFKTFGAMVGMLEATVRVYGPPPRGGTTSGEIRE